MMMQVILELQEERLFVQVTLLEKIIVEIRLLMAKVGGIKII